MKKIIIFLMALSLLSACSRNSNTHKDANARNRTVLVNEEKPTDYYNRFLYHTSGNCRDYSLNYHYLNSQDITLTNMSNRKQMKIDLKVYLHKDKIYQADYQEREVSYVTNDGYGYSVTFQKRISGTWKTTKEGQLVLENLGVGSPLKYNDRPAVLFKPTIDIHQPWFKSQSIILSMVASSGSQELYDSVCIRK